MSQTANLAPKLPRWVVRVGSLAIILHFLAIGSQVLSAANGPWPTRMGESMADGPYFAVMLNRLFFATYLEPLRMTHNYHYPADRPLISAVYLEARLKDAQGNVVKTIKIPEETGNFWLRHRYNLLALGLGNDQPVQVNRSEVIPAPGQQMPKVSYWQGGEGNVLTLVEKDEHLVPKDRPVMRPSEWSLLLARSYQRYLSRRHNVAGVELIRHSREPIMPGYLLIPPNPDGTWKAPDGTFDELVSNFGEYRREK